MHSLMVMAVFCWVPKCQASFGPFDVVMEGNMETLHKSMQTVIYYCLKSHLLKATYLSYCVYGENSSGLSSGFLRIHFFHNQLIMTSDHSGRLPLSDFSSRFFSSWFPFEFYLTSLHTKTRRLWNLFYLPVFYSSMFLQTSWSLLPAPLMHV